MVGIKVERLLVNYKTLEDFKRFQAYGNQELSMQEDLQNEIVENDSKSPFYGIYYGNTLVARMSLYERSKEYDHYFNPPQDYLVLFKLEVLPDYRNRGYGKMLVDYAKSFGLPIKTNPFINSHDFWKKMGFEMASYNLERDLGENPFIWMPEGVKEAIQPPHSTLGNINEEDESEE
ncbi:MAG TPA: N-acetyltransferase [Pseudogracilibacillus sp.]|nr:N-acetyltransferase [Pseudogracilibacillus sp.]